MNDLDSKTQEAYYENYWKKIKYSTNSVENAASDFFRDYLIAKGRAPCKKDIYSEFKDFIKDANAERLLKEMTDYGKR